jgi:hypothetical protein
MKYTSIFHVISNEIYLRLSVVYNIKLSYNINKILRILSDTNIQYPQRQAPCSFQLVIQLLHSVVEYGILLQKGWQR